MSPTHRKDLAIPVAPVAQAAQADLDAGRSGSVAAAVAVVVDTADLASPQRGVIRPAA